MAVVHLSILSLVSSESDEQGSVFTIRPLFLQQPVATHARYERAVELYKKDLDNVFKEYRLSRANEDMLFWLMFQPKVHFAKKTLHIRTGKSIVSGMFTIAHFEVGGYTFVLLPDADNYMCMAEPDERGKVRVDATAEKALRQLFTQMKSDWGAEFDPAVFQSPRRQYITSIDVSVQLKTGPFSFERADYADFFMRMNSSFDFEGGEELLKTSTELNNRFPSELKRAHYRDDWADMLYHRLFSPDHVPLALVGPEGVGRHTLLEETVHRYLQQHRDADISISPKAVWLLDPVRIITGMSVVGMWQKRFESIIRHIIGPTEWTDKPDVMVVDNPVALLRIGRYSGGNLALADVLKPYLEARRFPFLLLATPEEWSILQEQDRRFSSLFQVIRIDEAPRDDALRMLLEKRKSLEREYGSAFRIEAVDQLINIHRNYLSSRVLPGSVAKMMERLSVKFRHQTIDAPDVLREFQNASGLSEVFLDDTQMLSEEEVRAGLESMLVGQPEALDVLAGVVMLIKSKLADKTKPVASMLLAGPTGVGKTQAAKALCRMLTGSESALMRFDMNEYIDGSAVQRLIGSFAQPEGQLTSTVRHNPFGVLLLDEIEKANPKVHDLLLQLLDDGRLTDSLGRTVDFSNVVVVMTSNLGAADAASVISFGHSEEDISTVYVRAVEKFFRPEFVNRIDNIIPFRSLDEEQIYQIARLQLREILQRDGFVRRNSILNVDQNALRWVSARGYDKKMGGRALKRQIESDLTELSADQLITIPPGDSIILDISLVNERLQPRIRSIRYALSMSGLLPEVPDEAKGKSFLQQLQRRVDTFRKRLADSAKRTAVHSDKITTNDVDYFELKENVESLLEEIQHLHLSYKGEYLTLHKPVSPLRTKQPAFANNSRNFHQEKTSRDEMAQEVRESYRFGLPHFNSAKTIFTDLLIRLEFLQIQLYAFLEGRGKDKIELRVSSMANGAGRDEMQYLLERYEALFRHWDVTFRVFKNAGKIEATGFGLTTILKPEAGIHLFNSPHDSGIPILLSIQDAGQSNDARTDMERLEIIREYDQFKLLSDVRSGLINDMQTTVPEMQLLLYCGMKAVGGVQG
ncbi:MAG TPA: AAA family ATPase [Saprospiraceae bacterium]|nr:AAA family ATPase [Saprospiraceae bacterium]